MKYQAVILFCAFLICCVCYGCKVKKEYIPIVKTQTEKVTVVERDTIVVYELEYIYDSIKVKDTFSILENKYSTSLAMYTNDSLIHTLKSKGGDTVFIKVPYVKEVRSISEKEEIPIYINRPDRWQDKLYKYWFYISFMLIVIVGLIYIRKIKYI